VDAPAEVVALAEQRAEARAARDFAAADRLRDEIAAAGWVVADTAAGFDLRPRPPYDVLPSLGGLPDHSHVADHRRATVSVVVDGWPDDVRTCLDALLEHTPSDVVVQALDLGDVDGAGAAMHEFAGDRLEEWHVEAAPAWRGGSVGWGHARAALLRADVAAVHVWCDLSTVLTGDAVTPMLDAIGADREVAGAGWRGADVDVDDEWRSVRDTAPGDVDVLLGYLFAMRRDVALAAGGPHAKARFYRNADLEFSLALRMAARAAGTAGRLVALGDALPCRQDRHRGYHDTDPDYRDNESAKTYSRMLQRFRNHPELILDGREGRGA
jgi:hypothetical protein